MDSNRIHNSNIFFKKYTHCSHDLKDCQHKYKKKPPIVITWMSLDFYKKVIKSCRSLLGSVQKLELESVIDNMVKIYDALMYMQGEYK